ncbi:von Willebrand factor A domain-containing protein 7-like isoform X2 [Montipora capricornis]|uniref:von Willebrand factor A domain-containing protein 7-like isoform X2 n=1 Tax=Montipora capricornis TaxID=246305 RepID=UPI0035F18553
MAVFRGFVFFLSIACRLTEAFLPSVQLVLEEEAAFTTRDHAIITKIGLLQSMVEFFKENSKYTFILKRASNSNGNLSNILISADNPDQVDRIFRSIPSIMPLQNAIKEILDLNAEVDSRPMRNISAAHYSGKRFLEASRRLLQLRSAAISTILRGNKYEHSRKLVGQYLHTLQDFYSHSNWIELGNRVAAFDGLLNKGLSIPLYLIAKPNETTCNRCPLGKERKNNCNNTLTTEKLTSGYHQGQHISKQVNITKCIHGGISDSNGDERIGNGINKDSTSRQWSPHYKLHTVASELAIGETKTFFDDLRSAIGPNRFARFLNLQAVRTLALVIDDTGSMRKEIKAVRELSKSFVRKYNDSIFNTGFMYILVPFNDPEVGPVTVTSNPDDVIKAVNSLKAHAGKDCPELGMTGLYQALLHSVQDSVIYYFSDADAKDSHLAPAVLILAKQKRVQLHFILTGQCSYRRKRRSVRLPRDTSQLGSQELYKSLAAATGGQVLITQKSKVSVVVDIIASQMSAEDDDLVTEVILLDVRSDLKQEVEDVSYFIEADNTLKNVLIVLSSEGNPDIVLFNPSENKPITINMMKDLNRVHVTETGSFEGGRLEIRVRCTGPYTLQVTGRSALDFTYQLSLVENTDTGTTRSLLGEPVIGQTMIFNIAFTKPHLLNEVRSLSLVNTNGTVLESFPVKKGQGIHRSSYYVLFSPTAQRFRFQLTARTNEGKIVQRTKPTEIKMETVELSFDYQLVNNVSRIFPGVSRKIPLNIRNAGSSTAFRLNAIDDLGYVQSVNPGNHTVAKNETVVVNLIMRAPSNATPGDTSTVTVYAIPENSQQPSNYMMFYVSVAGQNSELFPPRCEAANLTEKCDAIYYLPNCSYMTWTSNITLLQKKHGLLTMRAKYPEHGQLKVSPLPTGMRNSSGVKAIYTSTCCHPSARIIAVDRFGNTVFCDISTVTPVINIEAQTYSSELDIKLGETTKVQFSVTNRGTKVQFTLQISENTHLMGYASPLNVKLDHKESAQGQLVLTGLKATGSQKTSLELIAIPHTETANNSHVKLMVINVTVGTIKTIDSPLEWNITAHLNVEVVVIPYGMSENTRLTLTNHGIAGTFDLKVSPSVFVDTQFALNAVHLNTGEKMSVELEMTAKRNRNIEGTIVLSAMPRKGDGDKEIKLLNLKIRIIQRETEKDQQALRSSVPNRKLAIKPGSTVTVNFTVINIGRDQHFFFKISSPDSITSHVTPEWAFIKGNMTLSGQLTVKSSPHLQPGNMKVNVTAMASAGSSTETCVLTLDLDIVEAPFKPDEIKEKEQSKELFKIIGIAIGCILLLILILFLICLFLKKRGSWTVWKNTKSNIPIEKDQEETVNKPELV